LLIHLSTSDPWVTKKKEEEEGKSSRTKESKGNKRAVKAITNKNDVSLTYRFSLLDL